MKTNDFICFFVATACALVGCGSGSGAASDGGPAADAWTCPARWRVATHGAGTTSRATVEGGDLILAQDQASSTNLLSVTLLTPLTGDFDLELQYADYTSGGAGAFAQAILADESAAGGPKRVVAGRGSLPQAGSPEGVSVAFLPSAAITAETSATSGSFRFSRTGRLVTATSIPSGAPASVVMSTDPLSEGALSLGLQVGASPGSVAGTTSLHVTGLVVRTGAAGVPSDDFACDSLQAR